MRDLFLCLHHCLAAKLSIMLLSSWKFPHRPFLLKEDGVCVGKLWFYLSVRNAMSAFGLFLNIEVEFLL